jgi:hypothetical protein
MRTVPGYCPRFFNMFKKKKTTLTFNVIQNIFKLFIYHVFKYKCQLYYNFSHFQGWFININSDIRLWFCRRLRQLFFIIIILELSLIGIFPILGYPQMIEILRTHYISLFWIIYYTDMLTHVYYRSFLCIPVRALQSQ